jgi:hypothetical protein
LASIFLHPNPDLGNFHCERSEAIPSLINGIATPAYRNSYLPDALMGHFGVQARTFQVLAKKG